MLITTALLCVDCEFSFTDSCGRCTRNGRRKRPRPAVHEVCCLRHGHDPGHDPNEIREEGVLWVHEHSEAGLRHELGHLPEDVVEIGLHETLCVGMTILLLLLLLLRLWFLFLKLFEKGFCVLRSRSVSIGSIQPGLECKW